MIVRDEERQYGSSEVSRQLQISLRQLYHWVDVLHVVTPQVQRHGTRRFRRFTPAHVHTLRAMRDLVHEGYQHQAAVRLIRETQQPLHPSDSAE